MKTWVKLYTEINRDADIGSLTWAQRGIWAALLALAGEIDDRDEEEIETGALDTLSRVAWHLRMSEDELEDAVVAFSERGMVDERDGILYLTNYVKRQGRAPSTRPTAVAGRVKRHRARVTASSAPDCNDDVTSVKRAVTSSDSDTDAEADSESEAEADAPQAPATAAAEPRKGASGYARALADHGIIVNGSVQADMWRDLYEEAGAELFVASLDEAVRASPRVPAFRYVQSIVKRCLAEGTMPGARSRTQARASPLAGIDAAIDQVLREGG